LAQGAWLGYANCFSGQVCCCVSKEKKKTKKPSFTFIELMYFALGEPAPTLLPSYEPQIILVVSRHYNYHVLRPTQGL
jgi:hypothetical protein